MNRLRTRAPRSIAACALMGLVGPVGIIARPAAAQTPNLFRPTVHITAPIDGQKLTAGEAAAFAGDAYDPEDGDRAAGLVWTSSLDGEIGRGGSFSRLISEGEHVITAAVTDSGGATGTDSVRVTVVNAWVEFAPVADTYVDSKRKTTRYGSATRLIADGSAICQSFFRFNVSGLGQLPVKTAILRLTVGPTKDAGSDSGGILHVITSNSWSESGTNYNTRPAIDGRELARAGQVVANQVVEFDVTSEITVNGTYNFALVSESTNGAKYRSREATSGQPKLIVTFEVLNETPQDNLLGRLLPIDPNSLIVPDPSDLLPEPGDILGGLNPPQSTTSTTTTTTTTIPTQPSTIGYEDFQFGPDVEQNMNRATAEKPESKLWHHDGIWWSTLYRPEAAAYRIHRFDSAVQNWTDTGVSVDERGKSRQDVLLDGQTLYMVSRFGTTSVSGPNRLYRFTYVPASQTWSLDAGFPVDIAGGGTESMTVAKDSTGTLWIAYTLNSQVFVSHTMGSDMVWSDPFVPPVPQGTTVHADDIAGVVALQGKIGVFWSNQVDVADYFAVHTDGDPPTTWTLETPISGSSVADDHFNMKLASDGRLFVALKTSKTSPDATLVGLLVRAPDGTWSALHQIGTTELNPTRPLCMLDEAANQVYVFYAPNQSAIYYKVSDMGTIAFPGGSGTPFMASDVVADINNPTGTKQNIDVKAKGLVVVGSSPSRMTYWHNAFAPMP